MGYLNVSNRRLDMIDAVKELTIFDVSILFCVDLVNGVCKLIH